MIVLTTILVFTACLSPLLTAAHLWQVKEWRLDRLREHLRSEGTFQQLFGTLRPLFLILALPALLHGWVSFPLWTIGTLAVFTGLTMLQIAIDRQSCPLWTVKAMALATTASAMTLLAAVLLQWKTEGGTPLLALFPLLQPFALALALVIFSPLDRWLKRRIMERARRFRLQHPDLLVVGITGSVGKTTTKELLLHILAHEHASATPAYVNTEMGVSQWLTKELSGASPPKILIVEMGAYRRGEISLLCQITQPTVGIITFIGTQHIALFKSQEALLSTKAELFDALPSEGIAILNGDSPLSDALRSHAQHCRSVTVSTGEGADLEAFDIEETPTGIRFRAGGILFTVPLHGTHNVTNVLLAIAGAECLGMKRADIAKKLTTFRPPEHTFSVRTGGSVTLLDDTHNASAASFRAAIGWAKAQPAEEKILLSSGLIELGEEEDRLHAQLGVESVGVFDRVIFLHPRHAHSFERGFGGKVELLRRKTPPVSPASLLICVGRIPEETIRRLLPKS